MMDINTVLATCADGAESEFQQKILVKQINQKINNLPERIVSEVMSSITNLSQDILSGDIVNQSLKNKLDDNQKQKLLSYLKVKILNKLDEICPKEEEPKEVVVSTIEVEPEQ